MPTTLPGGLWYPERDTILYAGGFNVVVAPGDAIGAQFSFGGAVTVRGAGMGLKFDTTGDFTLALTEEDGTVLRATAWPGTLNPQSAATTWVPCTVWDPVDLAADTPYRLVCTATGAGSVAVGDVPAADTAAGISLGIPAERLGYTIRRVAGLWTAYTDRRLNATLHVGGF